MGEDGDRTKPGDVGHPKFFLCECCVYTKYSNPTLITFNELIKEPCKRSFVSDLVSVLILLGF